MGAWFDLALLALLIAVCFLLYRQQERAVARPAAEGEGGDGGGGWWRYYPRLARQAGFDPAALAWIYWLLKVVLLVALPLLAIEIWAGWGGWPGWPLLILFALVGFFVPELWLWARRRRRRREIRNGLSYFLDLIVSLLHSGLGLEGAFRRAAREGLQPGHALAHEAGLVDAELGAGKERVAAFDSLAGRTGVKEFRSVAAALELGLRLGNPVQETLSAQAELLRAQRREEARRALGLAPLKTLIPVMLCGFPVLITLVLFPAIAEMAGLLEQIQQLFARF